METGGKASEERKEGGREPRKKRRYEDWRKRKREDKEDKGYMNEKKRIKREG